MRTWFDVQNKKGEADIYIYDEIGAWGVAPSEFIREINALKVGTLNLHINSPGGQAFDGIAIYNALKRHPATVNVTVDGLAASIASVIAQAGDRVVMAESATMMIHEPWIAIRGDSARLAQTAEWLGKLGDGIADIYAGRAGGESPEWRTRMKVETWYRAREAVDAGLADEVTQVVSPPPAVRAFNLLSEFKRVPATLTLPAKPAAVVWTTAFINGLPDSSFAYIAEGGRKYGAGTVPRTLRYLPHHGPSGALDLPHLRNVLARAPLTTLPAAAKQRALRHLQSHARRAGVGEE
ncbi:hypothetical protein LCGC14_1866240 [marine sediment metagenome]|uniref:ATP-dependent Clp protease proteolytic subunit n=1 Tax=marine sediment metagenome TaxID=412755 RepID=A0A0F9GUE3_9ZZZZ